jgi:hypothetical protein
MRRAAMDGEPERQEPEIMPPVPKVAPGRRTKMRRKRKPLSRERIDVSPSFIEV